MEIPKIKMPEIGGLDGLKERLGFGNGAADAPYEEYAEYDEYDEYDDYDDGYGKQDSGYGMERSTRRANGYRDIAPIDGAASARVRPALASGTNYASGPNLVSIDDVRAHTAAMRNADYEAESLGSGYGAAASLPAAESRYTPRAHSLAAGAGNDEPVERLRGYGSSYSSAVPGLSSTRPMQVIRPVSYEEAEQVAFALRRGDVVVLDLAVTDQLVYKRILDFSFGAACMANARVDCLASKVFSIQTGERLTSDEINQLRNQGVL